MNRAAVMSRSAISWGLVGVLAGAIAMIFALGSKLEGGDAGLGRATDPVGLEAMVFAEAEIRIIGDEISFRASPVDESEDVFLPSGLNGVVTDVSIAASERPEPLTAILEINGRPLFVAEGEFAFYRQIGWRDTGPDVEQLQQMLVGSGASLTIDGIFASATQKALTKFYSDRDYLPPVGADPSTVDEAAKARDLAAVDVSDQELSLGDIIADIEMEKAAAEPDPQRVSGLNRQRRDAERQLTKARDNLQESAANLSLIKGQAGAVLSPTEFWVVDGVVSVDLVALKVGHTVSEGTPIGQRTSTDSALNAQIPSSDAATFEQGMDVVVEDLDGERTPGVIEDISLLGEGAVDVTIRVLDARLATDRSYRVIVISDDEATPLLAVPVTAINQRVAGEPFVVIVRDTVLVEIPVSIASTGDGWAALTDPPASLIPGIRVAVGLDYQAVIDE